MRFATLLLMMAIGWPLSAQPPVAKLLSEIIRIDTSNPPGNERKMADYLAPIFRAAGFEVDIIDTPVKGKAHFIARLRGDGSKRPLLLAGHADVVGVEREKWTLDPFGGIIRDGYVYGRGAIDVKGGLAVFAQAALDVAADVKAGRLKLSRDLILLSEADEEGGSYPTSWLAQNAWDKIDCEFSLNEGGWIIKDDQSGKVRYVSISTADKQSISLRVRAKGTSTHSSMPLGDNAIFRLARALDKLSRYDTKPKLNDSTRQFFRTLAETSPEPMRTHFRNLVDGRDAKRVAEADRAVSADPLLHAIIRNTIAPVFLEAGFRGNVIPGSADATINFRVVPGTKPGELIDELQSLFQDPQIEVTEVVQRSAAGPISEEEQKRLTAIAEQRRSVPESPQSTELYQSLARQAKATYPEALVTPYLFQAGTDAYPWRLRGIPVYGIYPYPITAEDLRRMHGNDERVPVASLESGLRLIKGTIVDVCAKR